MCYDPDLDKCIVMEQPKPNPNKRKTYMPLFKIIRCLKPIEKTCFLCLVHYSNPNVNCWG